MFLKVDVDKCPGTAAANTVSAMPTFVFLRNRIELDRLRGADKSTLENKIKQFYSQDAAQENGASSSESNNASSVGCEGDFVINLKFQWNKKKLF